MKSMKKNFMAVVLLTALTVSYRSNAQKGFSLSVKTSPQLSFLHNSDDNDNASLDKKSTFNANFGMGTAYNFTEKAGVGLDVLYSLQGQRYEMNGKETRQKVNYIKVPVYYSYTSNPSKRVSFTGKLGPQLSVLSSSKLTDDNGHEIISDTKDYYKDVSFGGMGAAGVQFKLNRDLFLTTMARFDYDFTNAEDDANPSWPEGRAKTHNMTTGLEVGLKYVLQ
jgi:hypothetical protein